MSTELSNLIFYLDGTRPESSNVYSEPQMEMYTLEGYFLEHNSSIDSTTGHSLYI